MDDIQRRSLQRYQILGTLPEAAFDEITKLAADVCEAPIAMISFINEDCMWFKSHIGTELTEIGRTHSFCNFTVRDHKVLVVPDATLDDRFKNLPVVAGGPKVRFYAGAPLISPDGVVIGSLCVLATEPRNLSESQTNSLERLARLVMQFLESRVGDLGEIQAAKRDLEKQKEFLDTVFENLTDGIIACDADGKVHLFNEASRRFHGLNANQTVPQEEWAQYYKLFDSTGERLLNLEEIPLLRAYRGEIVKNAEMVVRTVDGVKRNIICNGRAFFDNEGRRLGAVVTLGDITEVRQTRSREHATNMTLQALIDLAPVGITMLDANKKITTWNKASEEITEWKAEEVVGKSIYEALSGDTANTERIDEQVNQNNEAFSSEMEYTTKTGKKVDVKISVVPIFDGEGKPVGSMGVSINISDLRERERHLLEANRVLKEASAAKSEFLANMSHEIRTPLNGVLAMSELISMTPLSEEQRDMLKTVQSSAQNLLGILSDILDFSKVEAGKLEIEHVRFDLKEMVQQTLRSVEPMAKAKNLTMTVSLPTVMGKTYIGDPGRIRQILLNLVSNAIKFTHAGEISTALSLTAMNSKQALLRMEILDSGIGISKEQLDRLFQAFSQADASTTRRFGGTGLGLSISHGLVELMKGDIGVESAEGQGSKFWFTLPLEIAAALDEKAFAQAEASLQLPSLQGTHVLVAEDNPVNQHIARAMLAKLGVTCEIVDNGRRALDALETTKYDLVLMDCQMPEMDGYEAARHIRAHGSPFQKIPIVALTAHAMAGDREKCLDAGMDDYLTKPLGIQSLAKILVAIRPPKSA